MFFSFVYARYMLHCKHASKRLDKRFVDRHWRLKKKTGYAGCDDALELTIAAVEETSRESFSTMLCSNSD